MFDREISAVFLGFLIILTPFARAYLVGNTIQQPRISVETFEKTVKIEGKKLDLHCIGKVTEYTNRTKILEFSVTIENITENILKIRMNFTKIVQSTEIELLRTSTSSRQSLSSSFEGQLSPVKIDNIPFVLAPGNGSIWVKYDHDDTYNYHPGYEDLHPGEPNTPWEIPIGKHGNQKVHTHLSIADVHDWKTGAKTREEILNKYLALGGAAAGSFLGSILGWALVNWLALTGGLGALVTAVAAAIGAFIGWLIQQLFGGNEAAFVENVVEAEQGDGFCWGFGFHTTDFDAYCEEIGSLWTVQNWYYAYECSQKLSQYHRIEFLCYEVREGYVTWGTNGINGTPETWRIEVPPYKVIVPAGIFADYSSLSK